VRSSLITAEIRSVSLFDHVGAAWDLLGAFLELDGPLRDLGEVADGPLRVTHHRDREAHKRVTHRPTLAVKRIDIPLRASLGVVEERCEGIEQLDRFCADLFCSIWRRNHDKIVAADVPHEVVAVAHLLHR